MNCVEQVAQTTHSTQAQKLQYLDPPRTSCVCVCVLHWFICNFILEVTSEFYEFFYEYCSTDAGLILRGAGDVKTHKCICWSPMKTAGYSAQLAMRGWPNVGLVSSALPDDWDDSSNGRYDRRPAISRFRSFIGISRRQLLTIWPFASFLSLRKYHSHQVLSLTFIWHWMVFMHWCTVNNLLSHSLLKLVISV